MAVGKNVFQAKRPVNPHTRLEYAPFRRTTRSDPRPTFTPATMPCRTTTAPYPRPSALASTPKTLVSKVGRHAATAQGRTPLGIRPAAYFGSGAVQPRLADPSLHPSVVRFTLIVSPS